MSIYIAHFAIRNDYNLFYRFPKLEAGGGPEIKDFIGVALNAKHSKERPSPSLADLQGVSLMGALSQDYGIGHIVCCSCNTIKKCLPLHIAGSFTKLWLHQVYWCSSKYTANNKPTGIYKQTHD